MIMAALKNPPPKSSLLDILWDIQNKRRYIAPDDITKISNEFNLSRTELEGIISFYHFFHTQHAGQYTIYLNNTIISKNRNYKKVKKAFEKTIGVSIGNTSEDKKFGLFETSCIGLSDQETAALINFQAFTNLTPFKVKKIVMQLRSGISLNELTDLPKNNIRYTPAPDKTIFLKPYSPGSALRKLKNLNRQDLITLVKESKLAGRGGAFFPTGMKWQFCKNNISTQKYVICNADEGEPGTFKDRVLMNKYPGLMLEGMAMAGYAVGANKGYIYLRAEYFYLKEKIEHKINEFIEKGFLGKNICNIQGFDFDIQIYMGAGAYVCGEETALISSMEGKRGEPSTKEYFPVEKGLHGQPTIINNVETLCAVPRIIEMGLEKYLKIGTEATKGTKLLSVSGDCKKPGVYEIEWGMKLKTFLDLIEAKDPYLVLFNGYAGECLSSADFNREISGENLLAEHVQFEWNDPIEYARKMSAIGLRSGGSFMVFNRDRDFMQIFKNINKFFISESCGICAPCRTGNFLLSKKLNKIKLCNADNSDLDDIKEWSTIIKQSSRCGLGKTSTNCLLTAMLKFPNEFTKCILAKSDINKAFKIENVVTEYDNIINEIENIHEQ
jgi:[NiFe] hydrogenase diaphorase moiety large subunit